MVYYRLVRSLVLGFILFVMITPNIPTRALPGSPTNIVANPGFENTSSSAWFALSNYHNGSVTVPSGARAHNGFYSVKLSAVNTTQRCPISECKDSVRAEVEQFMPGDAPAVTHLLNTNESFSAWWYVVSSSLPEYSLHFQLQLSDGSIIEYWYGRSDLSNSTATPNTVVFNLGPIPGQNVWFKMQRNLMVDVQRVVTSPAFTRVTSVWFGAFGGTYNSAPQGEIAWVDDTGLFFDIPPSVPIASFDRDPTRGTAPLTVQFNASTSHESTGFSGSIIVFMWDFGDGSPVENMSDPVTSHTFSNAGTFTVTLIVFDTNSARSSPSSTSVRVGSVLEDLALPVALGGVFGLLAAIVIVRRRRRSGNREKKTRPKIGRR